MKPRNLLQSHPEVGWLQVEETGASTSLTSVFRRMISKTTPQTDPSSVERWHSLRVCTRDSRTRSMPFQMGELRDDVRVTSLHTPHRTAINKHVSKS